MAPVPRRRRPLSATSAEPDHAPSFGPAYCGSAVGRDRLKRSRRRLASQIATPPSYTPLEDRRLLSTTNTQNQSDDPTNFFLLPPQLVSQANLFFRSDSAITAAPVFAPDDHSEFASIYGPPQAVPNLDVWENYHPAGSHGTTVAAHSVVELEEMNDGWFLVTLRALQVTEHLNLPGGGGSGGVGGGGSGGGGPSSGYQLRQTEYTLTAVMADASTAAQIEQSHFIDPAQFPSVASVSLYHSFLYEWTAADTSKDYSVTFYYDADLQFEWSFQSTETEEDGGSLAKSPSLSGLLQQELLWVQSGQKSVAWDGAFQSTFAYSGYGNTATTISSQNTLTYVKSVGDWEHPHDHPDDYEHTVVTIVADFLQTESYSFTLGGGGTRWGYMLTELHGRSGGPDVTFLGTSSVSDSPLISILHRSRTTETDTDPGNGAAPITRTTTAAIDAVLHPRTLSSASFSGSIAFDWSSPDAYATATLLDETSVVDWRGSTAAGVTELEIVRQSLGNVDLMRLQSVYDDAWGGVRQDSLSCDLVTTRQLNSAEPPLTTGTMSRGSALSELSMLPNQTIVSEFGFVSLENSNFYQAPPGTAPSAPTPGEIGPNWRGGFEAFRNPPPGSWGPGDEQPPALQPIDGQFGLGNKLTVFSSLSVAHVADAMTGSAWTSSSYQFFPDDSTTIQTGAGQNWQTNLDNSFVDSQRQMIIESDPENDDGLFYFSASTLTGVNEGQSTLTTLSDWAYALTPQASAGSNPPEPEYDVTITGTDTATSLGEITRADQTAEWGALIHHGQQYQTDLDRLVEYTTRRIELGGSSDWNTVDTMSLDSDGIITETTVGSGHQHTDVLLDRLNRVSETLSSSGTAFTVLLEYEIGEGNDGRGQLIYLGPPGGGGGAGGSGGSGGSGSNGGPQTAGAGGGHHLLNASSQIGSLDTGWFETDHTSNLQWVHTPIEEEGSSGGGSTLNPEDQGTTYDTVLTGTVTSHATSGGTSTIDEAFWHLMGEASGHSEGEGSAGGYDFYNLFDITLNDLISDALHSSSIDQTLTFLEDGSVELAFDGTSSGESDWSTAYTVPVDNRWLDEDGRFHQEQGELKLSAAYDSSYQQTFDDLRIRYLPAPQDDPLTEEDESLNVPDPIVLGDLISQFTNKKSESLSTSEGLVQQSFLELREGDSGANPQSPTFFLRDYARHVTHFQLDDHGHLRTTTNQSFLEGDVSEIQLQLEYLGDDNRSEWDIDVAGFENTYALHYTPDPYSAGGHYELYEQFNDYASSNVGQSTVTGGGLITFRRLPDTSPNAAGPYLAETSGQLQLVSTAQGAATANGSGRALRREFSVAEFIPGSTSGALFLGYGGDGQPQSMPGGQAPQGDKLHAAEFTHVTADHFAGTLTELLWFDVEADPEDASQFQFVPQSSETISSRIWGSKNNSERRWGHDFSPGGSNLPPWDVTTPDIDSYGDSQTPQTAFWGYHPEHYLSYAYRGFAIEPTPDPLNASSGTFFPDPNGTDNASFVSKRGDFTDVPPDEIDDDNPRFTHGIVDFEKTLSVFDPTASFKLDPSVYLPFEQIEPNDIRIALAGEGPLVGGMTPGQLFAPGVNPETFTLPLFEKDGYIPGVVSEAYLESLPRLRQLNAELKEWIDVKMYALLACSAYPSKRLLPSLEYNGWRTIEDNFWENGPFSYAVFYHEPSGQIVLAFAGTDELADWNANIFQYCGLGTMQYWRAALVGLEVKTRYGDKVIVVGHSLGGGLAALVAARFGLRAITFNGAGVHAMTLARVGAQRDLNSTRSHIVDYRVLFDPLSVGQWLMSWMSPQGLGRTVIINGKGLHPLDLHGFDGILDPIDRKIERLRQEIESLPGKF